MGGNFSIKILFREGGYYFDIKIINLGIKPYY